MSNFFLISFPPETISQIIIYNQQRVPLTIPDAPLQVEDKILPVYSTSGTILPLVYTVIYVNRTAGTVTLRLEQMYNLAVSRSEAIHIVERFDTLLKEYAVVPLVHTTVQHILNKMGGKRMEEPTLLKQIQNYIRARGYYFDDETLANYHICLKTRPFIILAGLSGTGKSKLTQLYAEALGHKDRYLRLPVRPNWNDDRYLLGYLNTITGEYTTEPAIEFIMEANQDIDNLYYFCLDEMNLAHVEYYFSQFLSAMEGEQPEDRQIRLYGKRMQRLLEEQHKKTTLPAQLILPDHLFFTGTINVDETTQSISDKVIDRANTIEFFTVDLDKIPQRTTLPETISLSSYTWQSYRVLVPDTNYMAQIREISTILNKANLGLGYRVVQEIGLYLANSTHLLDPRTAFDLQVKQRILPRIRGPQRISAMMKELHDYCKQQGLTRSQQRLQEMRNRLEHDGYTNFWR